MLVRTIICYSSSAIGQGACHLVLGALEGREDRLPVEGRLRELPEHQEVEPLQDEGEADHLAQQSWAEEGREDRQVRHR
jgi:hypothetical protein